MRGRSCIDSDLTASVYKSKTARETHGQPDHEHAHGGAAGIQTTESHSFQANKTTEASQFLHEEGYPARSACSHVGDVDDSLVAEARSPEIHGLLLAELEVLAAALARQEGGEHVLRDADPFVLQVQPI